jgi:hypothetical protein
LRQLKLEKLSFSWLTAHLAEAKGVRKVGKLRQRRHYYLKALTEVNMACQKRIKTPLQAIRAKCLDCSGGDATEVENCVVPYCSLYAYRCGMEMRCDVAPAQARFEERVSEADGPESKSRKIGHKAKSHQTKESLLLPLMRLA